MVELDPITYLILEEEINDLANFKRNLEILDHVQPTNLSHLKQEVEITCKNSSQIDDYSIVRCAYLFRRSNIETKYNYLVGQHLFRFTLYSRVRLPLFILGILSNFLSIILIRVSMKRRKRMSSNPVRKIISSNSIYNSNYCWASSILLSLLACECLFHTYTGFHITTVSNSICRTWNWLFGFLFSVSIWIILINLCKICMFRFGKAL